MKHLVESISFMVAALALSGCASIEGSIQSSADSSEGSIKSLTSPFESSSTSSGSDNAAHATANYQRDVRSLAVACASRDEAEGDLLRGLGRVAELHGISDWESSPATLAALRDLAATGELDEAGLARLREELAPLGPAAVASALGARNDPGAPR